MITAAPGAHDAHGDAVRSPELSIIIIGRNEQTRIAKCLHSVFAAAQGFDRCEVIYVDSASQDETVKIAQQFPIRILQLRPDWKLSPSAGRYIGYQHARGDFLMFVDGDTLLYKRWLKIALKFLADQPTCGGVAGIVHEACQTAAGKCVGVDKDRYVQMGAAAVRKAVSLGGIAMYRREAMEAAGTFNPYLTAGEEGEVALRIRRAGFDLHRLNDAMCLTYAPQRESIVEVLRRSRTRLFDFGTSLRYCRANKLALGYLREELWFLCTFVATLLATIAALVTAIWWGEVWPLAATAAAVAVYLVLKRKNPRLMLVSLLKRSIILYRTVRSFFAAKLLPVDAYPTDVIIVQ